MSILATASRLRTAHANAIATIDNKNTVIGMNVDTASSINSSIYKLHLYPPGVDMQLLKNEYIFPLINLEAVARLITCLGRLSYRPLF
jgi:hypothetical protein